MKITKQMIFSNKNIEILQALPIFGGISARALQYLLDRSQTCEVEKNQYFFHEGDDANSLYILEEGRVDIFKIHNGKEFFLRQLDKGACFGEVALMDLMPRSATVRACEDSRAIVLPHTALYDLYQIDLEQFTMIQMNMGREVSRSLRKADEHLFDVLKLK